MEEANKSLGYDVSASLPPEFVAKIETGLAEATKTGRVREFMAGVRTELQDHLDELSKTVVEDTANNVAVRVKLGGPHELLKVWGDTMDEFSFAHMTHSLEMKEIDNYLRAVTDPDKLNVFWDNVFQKNDKFSLSGSV